MNAHKNLSFCTALCLGLVLLATGSAFALVGDIAIYREAAGTNAITTVDFDHTFDTIVREAAGNYSLIGSDIGITEAGHYLALYSSRFDSTGGSNRSEMQSQLVVDGIDLSIGWSQGYIRRTGGADEAITAGGGIIEVGAGSSLSLRSFRTDSNGAGVQREPNATGIQLLQLDDSWDYLRLSATANQTGPTGATYIDVSYDTQDELDAGSFAHTSGSGDITLATAGHYMVFANTSFQKGNNNTRSGYRQRLTVDGNEVNGSLTTVYLRGNESTNDGATSIGTIIETTADNQVLNIEVNKQTGNNPTILGGRTGVTIVKLPDHADFIRLEDSTSQDFNAAGTTPFSWDTELELDASGFTHNGSEIGVAETDDYLFLANLYEPQDGPNDRQVYWQRWRENGATVLDYGQTARYSRDDGVHSNGNWSGVILDLDNGEFVEAVSQQLGGGGELNAVNNGLQGVRLSSLFASLTTLTWDGTDNGWMSAHWNDGPVTPAGGEIHIVNGGKILVQSDPPQAKSLTIDGGEVEVQPTFTLDVLSAVNVDGGTLDVDGTLLAGAVSVAPGATLELAGTLNATSLNTSGTNTIGAASTLTVTNALTLGSDLNMTGATLTAANAAVSVPAGTTLTDDADLSVGGLDLGGTVDLTGGARRITVNAGAMSVARGSTLSGVNSIALNSGSLSIAANLTAGVAPAMKTPEAHWAFDDATGSTAANSGTTGVTNDGTLLSFPVDDSQWVSGIVGGALLFDGVDDLVDAGATDLSAAYTLSMFVKTTTDVQPSEFSSPFTSSGNEAVGGGFQIDVGAPTDGTYRWRGGPTIQMGPVTTDWTHLAVTYDGETVSAYYNGFPVGSADSAPMNFLQFLFGRNRANDWKFSGTIDDARVYDHALEPAEIRAMAITTPVLDTAGMDLLVDGVSAVQTNADTTFASLSMTDGAALTLSSPGTFGFGATTVAGGSVTLDTQATTSPGPIAANGATIIKTGAGDLILDADGSGLAGATLDVQAGRLAGVQGATNPLGTAAVTIGNGELLLAAADGTPAVTYDNAITVTGIGTLTAGGGVAGAATAATVAVGGTNGIMLDPLSALTMVTSDSYTLNLAGSIGGTGDLIVPDGTTLNVTGAASTIAMGGLDLSGGLALDAAVADKTVAVNGGTMTLRETASLSNVETIALNAGMLDLQRTSFTPGQAAANPVAYWKFNEGTGLTAADEVNPGVNDGTLTGGPQWVAGVDGGALHFDGTDDFVDTPYVGIEGTNARSVGLWVKTTDTTDHGLIGWGDSNVNGHKWHLRVNTSAGNGTVGAFRTEVGGSFIIGSTIVADGNWHHLLSVFPEGSDNVDDVLVYVDGQLETISGGGSQAVDTDISGIDALPVTIGRRTQGANQRHAEGTIDDVTIYGHALTATEVAAMYGTATAMDVSGITLSVNGNSTVKSGATGNTAFAALNVTDGVLTTQGASTFSFSGTTISAGATATGISSATDVDLGSIDGGGAAMTFDKTGAGNLALSGTITGLQNATVNVRSGGMSLASDLTAKSLQLATGTMVDPDANTVTLSDTLTLGDTAYALSGAASFTADKAAGASGLLSGVDLTVNGGTLTITPPTVPGKAISVNFTTTRSGGPHDVTRTAGVVDVGNWNNMAPNATGGPEVLTDSDGAVTAATVTWNAGPPWDTGTTIDDADADDNDRLMKGYLDFGGNGVGQTITVDFAGIPFGDYSAYVYHDSSTNNRTMSLSLDAGITKLFSKEFPGSFNGTFALDQHDTLADAVAGGGGNYYLLEGLTDPTLNVLVMGEGTGTIRSPVQGVQIVERLPGVVEQETTNLRITGNTTVTTPSAEATLGNLDVTVGVTTLTLGNAVYVFNNASIADGVTVHGEWEVEGTLEVGNSVGTMTVDNGELVFGSDSTYNAEVNLGDGVAAVEADKIVVTAVSAIHLDGTLAPVGIGRTDSDFFSASTKVTIVDNTAGGVLDGIVHDPGVDPNLFEFAAVDPAPADDQTAHIGQGAFLRAVNNVRPFEGGAVTDSVDLDLFIALGGDADGDKKVWLSDWAALRANFGNTATDKTWTDGNFDPWVDGKVWLSDWAALRANFGNVDYTAAGAAAVPEPGTIVMLLGGLAGLALFGRRRRRVG